jgi:membrane fusion protein, heavy metal efflux system
MSAAVNPPKNYLAVAIALAAMFVLGAVARDRNWAPTRWLGATQVSASAAADHDHAAEEDHAADEHDDHAEHEHDDHAHAEETSLELSAEAQANLGLTDEFLVPLEESTFVRTVTVPAMVVERPGRTLLPVSTCLTGHITQIHAVTGEAVTPGQLLFQLRLTHEELVNSQKEFLKSVGDLEVELKELARIESASQSGALPGKMLLERQYAVAKLKASLTSQREALRLHGLSVSQVDRIEQERRLLTELRIYAPLRDGHVHDGELQLSGGSQVRPVIYTTAIAGEQPFDPPADELVLVMKSLKVHVGDTVSTGDQLCVLADYSELYLEGQAFETDAAAIADAKAKNWRATAVFERAGSEQRLTDLEIAFLASEIDPAARTLPFFVTLKNELLDDSKKESERRFVTWRFRPGQRMQLQVPVEKWKDQLVLPVAAVVKEGPDSFVFEQNGEQFDRIAVHERYRDRNSVVVASDGTLFPGDVVALKGAHQMQLAIKNKAGGGVDPHAGHSH